MTITKNFTVSLPAITGMQQPDIDVTVEFDSKHEDGYEVLGFTLLDQNFISIFEKRGSVVLCDNRGLLRLLERESNLNEQIHDTLYEIRNQERDFDELQDLIRGAHQE